MARDKIVMKAQTLNGEAYVSLDDMLLLVENAMAATQHHPYERLVPSYLKEQLLILRTWHLTLFPQDTVAPTAPRRAFLPDQ